MKASVHVTVRQQELADAELGEILTTPLSTVGNITSRDVANTLSLNQPATMNSEICQLSRSKSIKNIAAPLPEQSPALMAGLLNSQEEIKVLMKLRVT
jgi:hypothetical protein